MDWVQSCVLTSERAHFEIEELLRRYFSTVGDETFQACVIKKKTKEKRRMDGIYFGLLRFDSFSYLISVACCFDLVGFDKCTVDVSAPYKKTDSPNFQHSRRTTSSIY